MNREPALIILVGIAIVIDIVLVVLAVLDVGDWSAGQVAIAVAGVTVMFVAAAVAVRSWVFSPATVDQLTAPADLPPETP